MFSASLDKLALGTELPALLDAVVLGIEAEQPGCIASILLVDEEGRLRKGAAPNLPEEYCAAIDGLPIGDGIGSCGTAAFRGERVVVVDIQQHPYWEGYRDLAARAGVAACWSQPVFDAHGQVVATFAMYAREPHAPSDRDLANIVYAANLASIAITRHRDEKTLRMAMKALETTRESVYWLDEYGRILYANPATERELGFSSDELRHMTLPDIDPSVAAELRGPHGETAQRRRAGALRKFRTQHRHRDGHLIPVEVNAGSFEYDDVRYSMGIVHEIGDQLAAEAALRQSEEKFRGLVNQSVVGIAIIDDGKFAYTNPKLQEMFGYTAEEARTLGPLDVTIDSDRELVAENIRKRLSGEERQGHYLTRAKRKDGTFIDIEVYGNTMEFGGRRVVLSMVMDVTERMRTERELCVLQAGLRDQSMRDPLTGLYNRRYLEETLERELAVAERRGIAVCLIMSDLDHFKRINDRYGHLAGDRVLRRFADLIKREARRSDICCRYGGEEFLLVLPGIALEQAVDKAERLGAVMAASREVQSGRSFAVTASFGVACFPSDGETSETLIGAADRALYAAKSAGRNRVVSTHSQRTQSSPASGRLKHGRR